MRFEEWDVLLFPKDSKIPMKEFKTNCHVVQDSELSYMNGSFGLPTMTCFMPGLPPGTPFNISLHSWKTPDISQVARNYSKHPEFVMFEARVLIDGRQVATSSFSRTGPWPQLISHSFEFTKNGELEVLKFPQFRSELLRQSYWSPADEVGRIKIVISEGFPRDSMTLPMERVKNVVAFSFQHAPLDILESSGIAWPNPAMWRRGPFNPTMPVQGQQHEDGPEAHIHSPRRRSSVLKATAGSSGCISATPNASQMNHGGFPGNMMNVPNPVHRGGNDSDVGYMDPFKANKADFSSFFNWPTTSGFAGNMQLGDMGMGKASMRRPNAHSKITASDTSMPDYCPNNTDGNQSMDDYQSLGFFVPNLEDQDVNSLAPKAPANTPTTLIDSSFVDDLELDMEKVGNMGNTPPPTDFFSTNPSTFSSELATCLTKSLLNQPHPLPPVPPAHMSMPAPEVRSRKENRSSNETSTDDITTNLEHIDMRKVSQSVFGQSSKVSRDASNNSSNSPSQSAFSSAFSQRSFSGPDFGEDLSNATIVFTHGSLQSSVAADSRVCSSSEKTIKRPRHFTPASVKAIEDEDVFIRRNSPRDRLDAGEAFGGVN